MGAGADLGLTISLDAAGREVLLEWNAAAGSSSTVEFKESLADENWQTLITLKQEATGGRTTVRDAVGGVSRVYRVRVDAVRP